MTSIHFQVDVLDGIVKSCYRGQVYMGVQTVPLNHLVPYDMLQNWEMHLKCLTNLSSLCYFCTQMVAQITVSHLYQFNRQSFLCLLNLDYICAVRIPLCYSWTSPAVRIKSFLNVGLQNVGVKRTQCSGDLKQPSENTTILQTSVAMEQEPWSTSWIEQLIERAPNIAR